MPAPPTRPSLVLRLRDSDDHSAWQTFDTLYAPLIRNFCLRQGLQPSDASDVTQESLAAVATAVRKFDYDPSKGSFHAWLFVFTRNRLHRFYRQRDRLPEPIGSRIHAALDDSQPDSPDPEWEADFRKLAFDTACQQVRPAVQQTTWQAFWKTAIDGTPPDQVAAELQTSVGAVYIAKSRVLARLRAAVEELTDQPYDLEFAAS